MIPSYRLDDADLALIEVNEPRPLVQALIDEIRRLRYDNLCLGVKADELLMELEEVRERDE